MDHHTLGQEAITSLPPIVSYIQIYVVQILQFCLAVQAM